MKTQNVLLLFALLTLITLPSGAQVKIDFNSTGTLPHLLLKEQGDDFARLFFQNVNTSSGEAWSVNAKLGSGDTTSRFRIFYDGFGTSGAPLVITGDLRLGIGTADPAARLNLKQGQDQEDMGFRISNAGGTGSGRMWMNGNDLKIYAGNNSGNGMTFKPNGRIGAFTSDPDAKFAIYESDASGTVDLFDVSRLVQNNNLFYTIRILEAKHDGDVYIRRLGIYEDSPSHQLDINTGDDSNPFRVRIQDVTKLRVLNNGGTSIGSGNESPPEDGLHVEGQVHIGTNAAGTDRLQVRSEADENPFRVVVDTETKLRVLSTGGTSIGTYNEDTPVNGLFVEGNMLLGDGSDITLKDNSGTTSIHLNADHTGKGRITTDELEITGGSDISEKFVVQSKREITPGTLVSIDPQHPGQLCVTKHAYDTKVAGVISGANGISTGLIMGQKGTIADGEFPIALTGRVYVKADASAHAIKPGDLLTSSGLPGYVMKVTKHKKATGAIVGKALTSLEVGQGEVMMLISLQ